MACAAYWARNGETETVACVLRYTGLSMEDEARGGFRARAAARFPAAAC